MNKISIDKRLAIFLIIAMEISLKLWIAVHFPLFIRVNNNALSVSTVE